MKKVLKFLTCLLLCFSLAACNFDVTTTQSSDTTLSSSTTSSSETTKSNETTSSSETTNSSLTSQSTTITDTTTTETRTRTGVSTEATPGVLSLNEDSYVSYSSSTYEIEYDGYNFEFSNTSEPDDAYIQVEKGGYLLNITPFGDIDSFTVEYSVTQPVNGGDQADYGFGSLYYVTDNHFIDNPRSYKRAEVTNGAQTDLSGDPNYIAFYTFNSIEIRSITINYSTTAVYAEKEESFTVDIIATNDIHGQVNSDDTHAGLVNASGYIEYIKNVSKYNILLDQGDIYQGSLACYLTQGHVMDDYLLINGYDSTIVGNHEWDWGESKLPTHMEYSPQVQLLACNIRYKDGSTPSWVRNYYVTERGGVKFGIIGCDGDIASSISSDMIPNIKFVTGTELENMISKYSDELKALGCDYIILQIHEGSTYSGVTEEIKDAQYTSIDYSKLQGKLNLVMESHTHSAYYHMDSYGIAHVQCGGYLSGLGKIILQVNYENHKPVITVKSKTIHTASQMKQKTSPLMEEINDWYAENVYEEECSRVVASLSSNLSSSTLASMQAEAYLSLKDTYQELSGYNVVYAGGKINVRSPGKLTAGDVTMSDVTNLFPFDNEMYLCKIKGYNLNWMANIANEYSNAGSIIGNTINNNSYYYIIIDSYNYFYMTNTRNADLTIIVNLTDIYHIYPRDVFASYLGTKYPKVISTNKEITLEHNDFSWDYATNKIRINNDSVVTCTIDNVVNNPQYEEFTFKKNGGNLTFTCPEGYIISNVEISQYGTYKNLKIYDDSAKTNEITNYSWTTGNKQAKISLTNSTGTIVIQNGSTTNDHHLYYIKLTITNATK